MTSDPDLLKSIMLGQKMYEKIVLPNKGILLTEYLSILLYSLHSTGDILPNCEVVIIQKCQCARATFYNNSKHDIGSVFQHSS